MALEEQLLVVVRKYKPNKDIALIFSTWRNSIWFDEPRDAKQANTVFRKLTQKIKNIINNKTSTIKIACLKEDPDIIVGYSVFTQDNLEWIYVKPDYRKKKIGAALAKGFKTISEPQTKIGKAIAKSKELKEKHGNTEDRQEK